MSSRDLPLYVQRGGELVWEPPFVCDGIEIYGFLLPVERSRIDRLLQRDLVVPSRGAVDRRAAFGYVAVVCATMTSSRSAQPPDIERGFVTEREVGFWCLTADAHDFGRLTWYLPYIYVDTGITVVSGREVYGYPKQLGEFDRDFGERLAAGRKATVSSLAIRSYGPDKSFKPLDMVTVTTTERERPGELHGPGRAFADLFRGKIAIDPNVPSGPAPGAGATITLTDQPPPSLGPAPPWYTRVLDDARGTFDMLAEDLLLADMALNPTLVFLKQFRDIASSTRACYQAVTESRFHVDALTAAYAELDASKYRITVASPDSSPIAADFGLKRDTPLVPERAFHASISFYGELGYEVWRAPT